MSVFAIPVTFHLYVLILRHKTGY